MSAGGLFSLLPAAAGPCVVDERVNRYGERARVRIISSRKEKKQGLCCVKFHAKLPESFKHHLQYVSICRPHLKALFVVLSLSPTSSFKSHLTVLVWLSRRRCLERGQGIICITADDELLVLYSLWA